MKNPQHYFRVKRVCCLSVAVFLLAAGILGASAGPDDEAQNLLTAAAKAWSALDFKAVRVDCSKILGLSGTPSDVQSYARLRIAQSYLAESNSAAARDQYEQIATNLLYPPIHRYEAEEWIKELDRVGRGLPGRDVTASRTRISPIGRFATEYFVAREGDDADPGDRQHPFATLEKARDAIRQLKAAGGLAGPVSVTLMPGEYSIAKTFELTAADSGAEAAPVVYRASVPGTAVLYGGTRLSGFVPVTNSTILSRLPAEARGKVYQCDLKRAGITDYSPLTERGCFIKPPPTLELFFNGAPMVLARWPKTGFVNGGRIINAGSQAAHQPSVFEYLDDRPARWTHAEDPWLYGYFRHGWADRTLKILSIDAKTKQIACGPYEFMGDHMEPVSWFNQGRIRYFAFNLLEELSSPGEWYLDRKEGILYFYPPAGLVGAVVDIGRLAVPMCTLSQVSHVRLEGLVFDLSRTDCMSLVDCDDCLVAGCTIKRFAGGGISVIGGHRDGILSCDLFSLGSGAMEVVGGERTTLTPAQHFVENCLMYSFGRLDHTYVPGIRMEGVGIRAAHNRFTDCPSSVIRFDGNDFLIEYNEVERAVLESEDQGAMETWGNPTFRGNILRYNRIAFIGSGNLEGPAGRAGIRLDDVICGTIIYANIFYHASQSFGGVNINSGRDNIIDNNVFAECERGVTGSYDAGNDRWKGWGKDPAYIRSELYLRRYPDLRRVDQPPGLNSAWRNVFWKCGLLFTTYGSPSAEKFDLLANAQYSADPGFVDAAKGDFRLKPDADVFRQMAFHPIPVDEIGLYRDEYRTSGLGSR